MPSNAHDHGPGAGHGPEIWPHRTDFVISNGSLKGLIDAIEIESSDQLVGRVDDFNRVDLQLLTRHLDRGGDPTDDQEFWLYDLSNSSFDPTTAVATARDNDVDASPLLAIALSG